ncbi:MAG: hypothetical protein M1816_002275 [Peltula sp. TS41687]|nr:MAG: hypothetical protein M1816_002275 [Peltula sp. TS41687]
MRAGQEAADNETEARTEKALDSATFGGEEDTQEHYHEDDENGHGHGRDDEELWTLAFVRFGTVQKGYL